MADYISSYTGAEIDQAVGYANSYFDGSGIKQSAIPNDVITQAMVTDSTIGQGQLKTSTWSGNIVAYDDVTEVLTVTGGEYGFAPMFKVTGGHDNEVRVKGEFPYPSADPANISEHSSYVTKIGMVSAPTGSAPNRIFHARVRYVTSSGEVYWIFVKRYRATKEVISMTRAPDHPCFGNGGDPLVVPHPFGMFDPSIHEIIVLNPDKNLVLACGERALKTSRDVSEVFLQDCLIEYEDPVKWTMSKVTVGMQKKAKIPKCDFLTLGKLRKKFI